MRIRFFGLAAALTALVLFSPRPVTAQGLASIAAATAATAGSATMEKAGNCYMCGTLMNIRVCEGGYAKGYKVCTASVSNACEISQPDCGGGSSMLVDPDGASQYVSRGSLLGVLASAESPPIRQNCEGVVVARNQSPDDIAAVRSRTGTLSL